MSGSVLGRLPERSGKSPRYFRALTVLGTVVVLWLTAAGAFDSSEVEVALKSTDSSKENVQPKDAVTKNNFVSAKSGEVEASRSVGPDDTRVTTADRSPIATGSESQRAGFGAREGEATKRFRDYFARLDAFREAQHVDREWSEQVASAANRALQDDRSLSSMAIASIACASTLCKIGMLPGTTTNEPGTALSEKDIKLRLIHRLSSLEELLSGGATAYSDGQQLWFYFARGGFELPPYHDLAL